MSCLVITVTGSSGGDLGALGSVPRCSGGVQRLPERRGLPVARRAGARTRRRAARHQPPDADRRQGNHRVIASRMRSFIH